MIFICMYACVFFHPFSQRNTFHNHSTKTLCTTRHRRRHLNITQLLYSLPIDKQQSHNQHSSINYNTQQSIINNHKIKIIFPQQRKLSKFFSLTKSKTFLLHKTGPSTYCQYCSLSSFKITDYRNVGFNLPNNVFLVTVTYTHVDV